MIPLGLWSLTSQVVLISVGELNHNLVALVGKANAVLQETHACVSCDV